MGIAPQHEQNAFTDYRAAGEIDVNVECRLGQEFYAPCLESASSELAVSNRGLLGAVSKLV